MKPKLFLQKKRKAPQKGFRLLHATTSRKGKRQRASTSASAEDLDEVPNFGVMSALVVILALHLVAIGAIYIHGKLNGGENYTTATEPAQKSGGKGDVSGSDEKYEHYVFEAGDNYKLIARKKGVALADLKKVNDYKEAGPGDVINLPVLKKGEKVVPELASIPESAEAESPIRPTSRPQIQVDNEMYTPEPAPEMVEVPSAGGDAILIKPKADREVDNSREQSRDVGGDKKPGRAQVVREDKPSRSHTIRSGDTIWRISRKYNVGQKELTRLNNISDPDRIRIGRELKIPN